ncbi:MAG: anaerobic ribonucleoside-triphosphate reductase activating protein [Clostridiales bacterium]|nr:anaerobic ribonucleoside-triphosphate reductase activating protein [Clostridiales bacterium]
MKISGIQKVTLVDYPGKVATTLFTAGCNFRCPFCHNAGLVEMSDSDINIEEILSYFDKRKGVITAVCVSGGEPTLHHDLPDFISKLKAKGLLVKLDTNGTNLPMLKHLVDNNLIDYIAMDIKNSPDKYPLTSGSNTFDNLDEVVEYIMSCGVDYEFRTTLVDQHHTRQDMESIGQLIRGAKKYYLQKFEDSGNCLSDNLQAINHDTAQEFVAILRKYIPNTQLRGY